MGAVSAPRSVVLLGTIPGMLGTTPAMLGTTPAVPGTTPSMLSTTPAAMLGTTPRWRRPNRQGNGSRNGPVHARKCPFYGLPTSRKHCERYPHTSEENTPQVGCYLGSCRSIASHVLHFPCPITPTT